MSAVNWTTVKNALHAWLTSTTGITAERILYGGQNAVRPKGQDTAWINLWIMGDDGTGRGSTIYKDNPTPTAGAELIKEVHGQRLVTVTITIYGQKNATDATEAYALMSDAMCSLDLEEVTDPLNNGGVSIQQYSATTTIGGIINTTRIEPRATCTVQFMTPSVVSRTMTYIETINTEIHVSTSHVPVDGETGTDVKIYDFDFSLVS
jgi:hypothetical protein